MARREGGSSRPDEFELIDRLFAPLAARMRGACELKDDVAYLPLAGGLVRRDEELVLKTDALIAGVHFLIEDPPALVARKLLRVNLSDLAAKGARPLVYTLAIMLPKETDFAWLKRFAAGLAADQKEFGILLAGGDTDSTPGPLSLSLTAIGAIPAKRRLLRAGARPGDGVFVSGTIGDGALGLKILRGELGGLTTKQRAFLVERYRLPRPRLELGARLRDFATAAMDISDGLVGDLQHVCVASRLGAVIEAERVPLSNAGRAAVKQDGKLIQSILGGGDDYELLFTAPVEKEPALKEVGRKLGVPVTRIGSLSSNPQMRPKVIVLNAKGREIKLRQAGYRHF